MVKYSSMYSSPIRLESLLRRRKTSLETWVREAGIVTYSGLVERCSRMGVVPPEQAAFERIIPAASANDPAEGLIVIEPAADPGPAAFEIDEAAVEAPSQPSQRKNRRGSRA